MSCAMICSRVKLGRKSVDFGGQHILADSKYAKVEDERTISFPLTKR
jgi:hypothetical protein